jgi:hypothetical protein
MADKSIEQRVKDIIVEQLGVNADQVTPTRSYRGSGCGFAGYGGTGHGAGGRVRA